MAYPCRNPSYINGLYFMFLKPRFVAGSGDSGHAFADCGNINRSTHNGKSSKIGSMDNLEDSD
ncbi:MAG TPA: hypothetical protein VNI52_00770 [Sphingobacteriaceae bacterium]|nr:hypothetical protein [Sphingobacteriaceae bacterium]